MFVRMCMFTPFHMLVYLKKFGLSGCLSSLGARSIFSCASIIFILWQHLSSVRICRHTLDKLIACESFLTVAGLQIIAGPDPSDPSDPSLCCCTLYMSQLGICTDFLVNIFSLTLPRFRSSIKIRAMLRQSSRPQW